MVEQLASLHTTINPKDKDGKVVPHVAQCLLQPVELWSYVFPEEHLDTILRTLTPSSQIGFDIPKGHVGYGSNAPKRKFSLSLLRKGLGLKPIPKWEPEGLKFPIWRENVQIVGLGIKEDYKNDLGNECL